jgi:hypothetical protein
LSPTEPGEKEGEPKGGVARGDEGRDEGGEEEAASDGEVGDAGERLANIFLMAVQSPLQTHTHTQNAMK